MHDVDAGPGNLDYCNSVSSDNGARGVLVGLNRVPPLRVSYGRSRATTSLPGQLLDWHPPLVRHSV